MNADLSFAHIAFDLDDTLLDTYRQLIPAAVREACQAMIQAGLNAEVNECVGAREVFIRGNARTSLYGFLVERFGVKPGVDKNAVAEAGYRAFHDRQVAKDITLFAGARDLLRDLKSRYSIHLVTSGHKKTQGDKIEILQLEGVFDSIHLIDPAMGQRKSQAFAAIMRGTGLPSEKFLSIGNRLDTDISEAKRLGWRTCWIRYGEYASHTPIDAFEKPDFEILSLDDLVSTCRL
jgi:FMN phosphatase YigB (HAD superfamily)